MSENKEIKLTPEELEAEKQDREILALVHALNGTNPAQLTQLFPDAQPVSELEYWAALGNIGKLKIALNNGCNVNTKGENDYTALHAAAENGHFNAVRLLVEQGAEVNAKMTTGETAVDFARTKYPEIVAFLESQGVA